MKLKKLLIFSFILIILYLQYGRNPVVNHSMINQNAGGYEANLTITVNKLFILSKKQLSKSLMQRIQENDFDNMHKTVDNLTFFTRMKAIKEFVPEEKKLEYLHVKLY